MFDLFRSRDTSMRYLLVVLLSLVALSMIVTLIPGFGSPSMGGDTTTMADVCGEKITAQQVSQLVQAQIRNREMSPDVADIAVPQIVNQMVGEMATSCQAKKMGLTVSDAEVASAIRLLMPMLWQNGEFAGKDAYAGYLQRMNTSIPQFEARVRQNLMLEKLQRVAFDGIIVAPKEVEAEYLKKNEKARVDVVKLDPEEYKKTTVATQAEIEENYKQNKGRYVLPPELKATLLIADVEKMGANLKPADSDLQKIYQQQIDRFKSQDRVKTRHILIKSDTTTSKEDDAKAKAKAQDLLNQIKGGADFAELAKKHSQDPGSGAKGGELDFYPRGQLDSAYEGAAYALKPKETSNLVKSAFGYHIIQTLEKETARTKPFEEVKPELLTEYRKSQLIDKIPQVVDQARSELLKNPSQEEQVAQKYGLDIRRVEKWTAGGSEFPVIGKSQEVDFAISNLKKGGVSDAIELPNSRMVLAVLDDVTPSRIGELKDVEDKVRSMVSEAKASKALETAADALAAKLKANGNDLKKAAAELNLKVVDSGDFDRSGQMPNLTGAFFGEQPFSYPIGFVASKFRIGSVLYFWKITNRFKPELAGLEKERALLVPMIRERKLRERRDLFEEGLVKQLKDGGSISVNEDAVKRVATSYRRS
jgi:peptidyl-prolyl cis-trans isomerase D